jgi:hypothetical protein
MSIEDGMEPVAYLIDGRVEQGLSFDKEAADNMAMANAGTVRPLYTHPAPKPADSQLVDALHHTASDMRVNYDGEHDHWADLIDRAANALAPYLSADAERDKAISEVVFRFIDRMMDVAPECGDPAERILGEFVAAMKPYLSSGEHREAGE